MLRSMSDPPFITLTMSRLSVSGSCSAHEKRCMHGQPQVCVLVAPPMGRMCEHQSQKPNGEEWECYSLCEMTSSAMRRALALILPSTRPM